MVSINVISNTEGEKIFVSERTKQKERKNVNMKNKKMNNKGFSLVELIIVIAIMAVLVGVLAPAYLRYVEKSRKSADVQAIDAVMSAMEAAAIDPSLEFGNDNTMTVVLSNSGDMTISHGTSENDPVEIELGDTLGKYQLKSSDWKTISIVGTVSGGQVTYKCTETLANEKSVSLAKYAPDLKSKMDITTASQGE